MIKKRRENGESRKGKGVKRSGQASQISFDKCDREAHPADTHGPLGMAELGRVWKQTLLTLTLHNSTSSFAILAGVTDSPSSARGYAACLIHCHYTRFKKVQTIYGDHLLYRDKLD
ncbi:hypothetical protein RRG08_024268 [Elysia crispata]|uniref:Uncharacterized protein n=1 Tax=Elysia crispata TaxID=231223 RepID=A0AAE1D8N7_9GAST|nr:hypothetical protein RRG08_024268 [Elysia crispata]